MTIKSLWTRKQRKKIDEEFQNKKGCLKSIFNTDSYILCGDATYDDFIKVFCGKCRIKFLNKKYKTKKWH